MKIKMLKKPLPRYSGQDTVPILAYEEEMNPVEEAIIEGIDATSQMLDNMREIGKQAASQYAYVVSGQAGRDAASWLSQNVGISINRTNSGGAEIRVDTPTGHVEVYANPPTFADSDSIRAGYGTNVGGMTLGTNITIANP